MHVSVLRLPMVYGLDGRGNRRVMTFSIHNRHHQLPG